MIGVPVAQADQDEPHGYEDAMAQPERTREEPGDQGAGNDRRADFA